MSETIIKVITVMVDNGNKVGNATKSSANDNELFFTFESSNHGTSVWSISKENKEYILTSFPEIYEIEEIVNNDPKEINSVTYTSEEVSGSMAKQLFSRLYESTKGRLYRINEIFEDIIQDSKSVA